MQSKSDTNPLKYFYDILKYEILATVSAEHDFSVGITLPESKHCSIYENSNKSGKLVDPILEQILINNGCKYNGHPNTEQKTYGIPDSDVKVIFLSYWLGNDVNEFFDVIDFYGYKYLVIFTDYFKGISIDTDTEVNDNDEPEIRLAKMLANSSYYDAIKKIVDIFSRLALSPVYGLQSFAATAVANNMRYVPAIVAINILNEIRPICENDVPDIPFDEVQSYVCDDSYINLLLLGIRKQESIEYNNH